MRKGAREPNRERPLVLRAVLLSQSEMEGEERPTDDEIAATPLPALPKPWRRIVPLDPTVHRDTVLKGSDGTVISRATGFVPIPGYERYWINKEGVVFSGAVAYPDGLRRISFVNAMGYLSVHLSAAGSGEGADWVIHRIVADLFPDDVAGRFFDGATIVNHLDLDRTNCAAWNLEWTTALGNNKHAAEARAEGFPHKKSGRAGCPVWQCDLAGNRLRRFDTIQEASRETGVAHASISHNLLGNADDTRSQADQARHKWEREEVADLENEEWRPLRWPTDCDLTGRVISNMGREKNKHGVLVAGSVAVNRYVTTVLKRLEEPRPGKPQRVRQLFVHVLVAVHYLRNPKRLPMVDHMDTDRRNNAVSNLMWSTGEDNHNNPITLIKTSRIVSKVSPQTGEVLAHYRSTADAAWSCGAKKNADNLARAIGTDKVVYGFLWRDAPSKDVEFEVVDRKEAAPPGARRQAGVIELDLKRAEIRRHKSVNAAARAAKENDGEDAPTGDKGGTSTTAIRWVIEKAARANTPALGRYWAWAGAPPPAPKKCVRIRDRRKRKPAAPDEAARAPKKQRTEDPAGSSVAAGSG